MSSYANLGKASSFPNLGESPWKEWGKRIKTIFLRRCSLTFRSTVVPYISSGFPGHISKCGCSSICHHAFIQSCNRKSFLLNVKISRYDHSRIRDIFHTELNHSGNCESLLSFRVPFVSSRMSFHVYPQIVCKLVSVNTRRCTLHSYIVWHFSWGERSKRTSDVLSIIYSRLTGIVWFFSGWVFKWFLK